MNKKVNYALSYHSNKFIIKALPKEMLNSIKKSQNQETIQQESL